VSIDTNDVFVGRFVERVFSRSLIPDACCGANDRAEIRTGSRPQLFFNNDTVVWPAEAEGGASAFLAAFYGTREITNLAAARTTSGWALYGAAVRIGGGAVVLTGRSGIGKTALLLALVAAGAAAYGDECVFIDRAGSTVDGLRRAFMIREPLVELMNSLPGLRSACRRSPSLGRATTRLWYAVEPNDIFGADVQAQPAPLRAIVTLDDERGESPLLEPASRSLAMAEFARRSHAKPRSLGDVAAAFEALGNVACYRLRVGEPAASAALIREVCAP